MSESIDRAAIEARTERATPGPWAARTTGRSGGDHWYICDIGEAIAHISASDGGNEDQRQPDAEFIAHAREDIPALLATLEDAESRIAAALAALGAEDGSPGVPDQNEWADRYRVINAATALHHVAETAEKATPEVVCICGSTRFRDEITVVNRELTLQGDIVLAPGVYGHGGDEMTDEQKVALDRLHFQKIDMADRVHVVNPGGYIGDSTRREIEYAKSLGKPVTYRVEGRVTLCRPDGTRKTNDEIRAEAASIRAATGQEADR